MEWILVMYFAGYNSGGPLAINFPTETACKTALTTLKEQLPGNAGRGVCINKTTGSIK